MRKQLPVLAAAGVALAAIGLSSGLVAGGGAAPVAAVPPAKLTLPEGRGLRTAVLAGGCFWGMEAVFEHVEGVRDVTSGYAGGRPEDANYDAVSTERTGHAEAIRIVYDPTRISYATLLRIYFAVAHDPTQLNRQGPDHGPSYRSAIFPIGADQTRVANAYIAQLSAGGVYRRPIVTRIERGRFFPAEAYHQDFARKNPNHPYIRAHDAPKVAALKATFPAIWRS